MAGPSGTDEHYRQTPSLRHEALNLRPWLWPFPKLTSRKGFAMRHLLPAVRRLSLHRVSLAMSRHGGYGSGDGLG